MKPCVRAILTEKRLQYCEGSADLQGVAVKKRSRVYAVLALSKFTEKAWQKS